MKLVDFSPKQYSRANDNAQDQSGQPAPMPVNFFQIVSKTLFLSLLTGFLLFAPTQALAQNEIETIQGWQKRLDNITKLLSETKVGKSRLENFKDNVQDISAQAQKLQEDQLPAQTQLKARLTELEPTKVEGEEVNTESESEELVEQRKKLTAELAGYDSISKRAGDVQVQSSQILATIAKQRSELFTRALFTRDTSILNPALWTYVFKEVPNAIQKLTSLISRWAQSLYKGAGALDGIVIGLTLLIGILIASRGRRFLVGLASRSSKQLPRDLFEKRTAAASIVFFNTIAAIVGFILILIAFNLLEAMPPRIERLARGLLDAVMLVIISEGLARAFLAPLRPSWRLIPVDNASANTTFALILSIALVQAIFLLATEVIDVLLLPLRFTIAQTGLHGIILPLLTLLLIRTLIKGLKAAEAEKGDDETPTTQSRLWRWLLPINWLAAIIAIGATIAGYSSLGSFIATQIFSISIISSLLALLLGFIDELFSTGFEKEATIGRLLTETIGLKEARVAQFAVILSGISKFFLIVVAFILAAAPWGFQSDDILTSISKVLTGFKVGSIQLSPSLIVSAIAIFTITILGTRAVQRWLETRFLPKTQMDVGLQNSITTALGYVGVILGAIIAFSYMGLNLSNIAIVAGALSVGIGFGLQSIVNNFVSGLILLAERPIKVGDWIVVGGTHGTVKHINVRATEIETFDRASMIVPNSDLISGTVTNYVHGSTMGRITVPVGVGYDSDPQRVREILFECAKAHPMVLSYPEAQVNFINFGNSSLDFELRCFLEDIGYVVIVSSDLRFEIMRRFREEGIEIPFPQRDINLRDIDKLADIMQGKAISEKPAAPHTPHTHTTASSGTIRDSADATGPDGDGR